jgi:hypothetical protein
MLSVADFVSKYEKCTDEELYIIHSHISEYSDEAQEALQIVLAAKGGLELIIKRLEEKQIMDDEIQRIAKDAINLGREGVDASFIKTTTTSGILSAEKVNEIIDKKYAEAEREIATKK